MRISEKKYYVLRKIKSNVMIGICVMCLIIAVIPLISILIQVINEGISSLNTQFITEEIQPLGDAGGGIGPAIQGTLIVVALACLIGIPIGIFTGIYLAEYPNNIISKVARFFHDILANMPSIVIGIFAWIMIVTVVGWSVIAGAFALGIMMLPLVTRATEEAVRMVPTTLKEASLALGVPNWKTTLTIVVPTAKKGIVTGCLLAIARVAGETAPLLLTILGSRFFFAGLFETTAALPLTIYNTSQSPYVVDWAKAWGASLVLIFMVLFLNILVRYITRDKFK